MQKPERVIRNQKIPSSARKPWVEAVETVVLAVIVSYLIRVFVFQAFYIPTRSMAQTLEPFDHILSEKLTYQIKNPKRGDIVIFNFGNEILTPDFNLQSSPVLGTVEGASGKSEDVQREYVKRVIGVAGDRISFRGGALCINGQEPDEPYIRSAMEGGIAFALRIHGKKLTFAGGAVFMDGLPLDEALPAHIPPASIRDRSRSNFVKINSETWGVLDIVVPKGNLFLLGDNRAESADSRFFGFLPVEHVKGRALATYWPPSRMRFL